MRRRVLSKEQYTSYIKNTPSRKNGSSRLFRNLEERGIISYSEYLFLLCVITSIYKSINSIFYISNNLRHIKFNIEPRSNFQIAFNMFDIDGNNNVEKNEFLVVSYYYMFAVFKITAIF